jgi:hypothetical protein
MHFSEEYASARQLHDWIILFCCSFLAGFHLGSIAQRMIPFIFSLTLGGLGDDYVYERLRMDDWVGRKWNRMNVNVMIHVNIVNN